ncbi:alpha/beta fold hydrolase [Rouxiella badensis]|jgi:pimeloyl-ACP methyl ester carboxylesterase|uniref:alpha/beta fold hydrolase n=1 Tax=Rouxiella badensis TaxID=1646377 RepID=UPI00036436BB|nr:alpha/beta hydrolase [Rouxiella badensis]MCC3704796.1 alpha/beta hydrolase [Rouxiella badensis]QOI55632.1 alpha/beta hydrolase [Rouxiella badensis subsp. acadiensis]WAT09726.1 alpha/beta hydrolase [Rouxiella badensis]
METQDYFCAQQAAKQHHYLTVGHRRLHYVTQGRGPAVLLIPGWPQTWYTWRDVMKHLAQAGFTAVAVDSPGTGESSPPCGGYDTGNIAALLNQLMQHLGHARYSLIGHDIGMWVGYAMGADFPDAVQRMVLTEAVIPGLAPAPEIFVSGEENLFLWHFMFNQLADLPEALTQGREAQYLGYIFDKWSWQRNRVAAEEYVKAYSAPGRLHAGFNYYRAIPKTIRQNQKRALTPLAMPVLAIGASHATRNAPFETMQKVAPMLESAMVSDCGHFITEECPEDFCALITPFLLRESL